MAEEKVNEKVVTKEEVTQALINLDSAVSSMSLNRAQHDQLRNDLLLLNDIAKKHFEKPNQKADA